MGRFEKWFRRERKFNVYEELEVIWFWWKIMEELGSSRRWVGGR